MGEGGWALEADGLVHAFGTRRLLDGVSLAIPAGGRAALIGASGSGKSTLLRCFNRLVQPDGGQVRVDGRDVRRLPPEALRRRLGFVPQDGGLLPHWTVLRNAALVPRLLGYEDADDRAADVLARVGLPPATFGARLPHELSGGQRQRAALARALAAAPPVLLLDEPFSALDVLARAELQDLLVQLQAGSGLTMLLVTHDLAEGARVAEQLLVLAAGRIVQRGTLRELRAAPASAHVAALLAHAPDAAA